MDEFERIQRQQLESQRQLHRAVLLMINGDIGGRIGLTVQSEPVPRRRLWWKRWRRGS